MWLKTFFDPVYLLGWRIFGRPVGWFWLLGYSTTKLQLCFFLVKNPTPSELESGITSEQRRDYTSLLFLVYYMLLSKRQHEIDDTLSRTQTAPWGLILVQGPLAVRY